MDLYIYFYTTRCECFVVWNKIFDIYFVFLSVCSNFAPKGYG